MPSARLALLATVASVCTGTIDLVTFDGTTHHKWHTENDPVMGGRSSSTWALNTTGGFGMYEGVARIVPSLKAPGFTIAMTETAKTYPDISSEEGLILGLRNAGGNVSDFKVAFCDSFLNYYRCQFGSFKADFVLNPSDTPQEVFVAWDKFSDKWSSATGKHTKEDPPTAKSLASVCQLQIWVEGIAGDFSMEVYYVRAGKSSEVQQ